jgi:hypothetical protein
MPLKGETLIGSAFESMLLNWVELSGLEPLTSCMPVSLGMSVPGIPAGTGQGGCLAAAGDSLHA